MPSSLPGPDDLPDETLLVFVDPWARTGVGFVRFGRVVVVDEIVVVVVVVVIVVVGGIVVVGRSSRSRDRLARIVWVRGGFGGFEGSGLSAGSSKTVSKATQAARSASFLM